MAGVISVYQVEAWFTSNCSIVDTWETWNAVWETDGLNDVEPPDPPMPPTTPHLRKSLWCQAIADSYSGDVPPGWPY